MIGYPKGFRSSDMKIEADSPMFIYINKSTLVPESFDIMNTTKYVKNEKGTYGVKGYLQRNSKPLQTIATDLIKYNSKTKEYTVYESNFSMFSDSYIWTCKPEFNLSWEPAEAAVEETSSMNTLAKWKADYDMASEEALANVAKMPGVGTSSNSFSSNNSSSSDVSDNSTSNTSTKKTELVEVRVDPNSKGDSWVRIYWDENGKEKKFTMNSRSPGVIGKIAVGTKLYYNVDMDSQSRTEFYIVPSGKTSVSISL